MLMLKAPMEKEHNIQDEQWKPPLFSREMETIRKNQTEILEIKNRKNVKKNRRRMSSNGLLSRLNTVKERISKPEDRSTEVTQKGN